MRPKHQLSDRGQGGEVRCDAWTDGGEQASPTENACWATQSCPGRNAPRAGAPRFRSVNEKTLPNVWVTRRRSRNREKAAVILPIRVRVQRMARIGRTRLAAADRLRSRQGKRPGDTWRLGCLVTGSTTRLRSDPGANRSRNWPFGVAQMRSEGFATGGQPRLLDQLSSFEALLPTAGRARWAAAMGTQPPIGGLA